MADKPILFSGPMVLALIDGTKTQTRRALNPQPVQNAAGLWVWKRPGVSVQGDALTLALAQRIAIGDRLFVREHWRTVESFDANSPTDIGQECLDEGFETPWCPLEYAADGARSDVLHWEGYKPGKLRQGMHMPRWASRITLTVTDVRVERLSDISEEDAIAEGWPHAATGGKGAPLSEAYPIGWYLNLWDEINGAGSAARDPWVAAYSFTVQMGNIDTLARAA